MVYLTLKSLTSGTVCIPAKWKSAHLSVVAGSVNYRTGKFTTDEVVQDRDIALRDAVLEPGLRYGHYYFVSLKINQTAAFASTIVGELSRADDRMEIQVDCSNHNPVMRVLFTNSHTGKITHRTESPFTGGALTQELPARDIEEKPRTSKRHKKRKRKSTTRVYVFDMLPSHKK